MAEIKLKPCPFCGCSDRRVGIRRMGNNGYRVVCTNCDATGSHVSIGDFDNNKMLAQAIAKQRWNTRKPMERIVEQLEKLQKSWQAGWNRYEEDEAFGAVEACKEAAEIVKAGGVNE